MRHWFKKLSKEEAQALLRDGILLSNLKKIDKALEAGADINHHYIHVGIIDSKCRPIPKENDMTALYIALSFGDQPLAIELLKRGADPLETAFSDTTSPIHKAAGGGMDMFIEAAVGHNYRLQDLPSTLKKPIFSTRHIGCMKALVAAGEDVNTYDKEDKTTPLYAALCENETPASFSYIQALLDAGADIYARTPEGKRLFPALSSCHRISLTKHVGELHGRLACEYGAGMDKEHVLKDGKPTTELMHYCGAGLLPELFTSYRWHGKESQALALFDEVKAALPEYYKPKMDNIDLSVLRREAGSEEKGQAVARYRREQAPKPQTQR